MDPADIPVPDDGTDFDFEDGAFWTTWLEEIQADEYDFVEAFHVQLRHDGNKGQKYKRWSDPEYI